MYVPVPTIRVRRTISQLTRSIRSRSVGMRISSVLSSKILFLINKMQRSFVKCLAYKLHCMIAGMESPAGKLKAWPKGKQTTNLLTINKNVKLKNHS